MKIQFCLLAVILCISCTIALKIPETSQTTVTVVKKHGFPIEEHQVQTSDGYILTLHRIPYSPRADNQNDENKPIVFIQHGLMSSSADFVITGPDHGLPYKLSDLGYDVWFGNARGNRYSRKHSDYNPIFQKFWNFDWHEIGIYDLPAMIDYVLYTQNQTSLQYIGHSQGTTAYIVMSTMIPNFANRIKSAHLLSPIVFMENMESPLIYLLAPVLGHPNGYVEVLGSMEFLPNIDVLETMGMKQCIEGGKNPDLCKNALFLMAGYDDDNWNATLIEEVLKTSPAGCSVNQVMHYLQEYRSGEFRMFDHFILRNKKLYGSRSPPNYDLSALTAPIFSYYGVNDYMASVTDVMRFIGKVPKTALKGNYKVPHEKWNHLDFIWGTGAPELLYEKVIVDMKSMD